MIACLDPLANGSDSQSSPILGFEPNVCDIRFIISKMVTVLR